MSSSNASRKRAWRRSLPLGRPKESSVFATALSTLWNPCSRGFFRCRTKARCSWRTSSRPSRVNSCSTSAVRRAARRRISPPLWATVDASSHSTCMSTRCAALRKTASGSALSRWRLCSSMRARRGGAFRAKPTACSSMRRARDSASCGENPMRVGERVRTTSPLSHDCSGKFSALLRTP